MVYHQFDVNKQFNLRTISQKSRSHQIPETTRFWRPGIHRFGSIGGGGNSVPCLLRSIRNSCSNKPYNVSRSQNFIENVLIKDEVFYMMSFSIRRNFWNKNLANTGGIKLGLCTDPGIRVLFAGPAVQIGRTKNRRVHIIK